MTSLPRIAKHSSAPTFMMMSDYLDGCKANPGYYAEAAERLMKAIGDPELVDTSQDARLGRIFENRTVKRYPAFADFYGTEDAVEQIVGAVKHAAQALESQKQILYLLGPVGGGKSSMADRIKLLMEQEPIYVLALQKFEDRARTKPKLDERGRPVYDLSPIHESPLWLPPKAAAEELSKAFGVPKRKFTGLCSPWATKRLRELDEEFPEDDNIYKFSVAKVYPSLRNQVGIAEVHPGDENNQDISTLVGKIDVRKLEFFSAGDPDAYAYTGGLSRGNQGILEFVEMFKAPQKMLHPLLTATQEGRYTGTENTGVLPFRGLILAHSNEAEWEKFRTNKSNEAFLDRVNIITVKYNLRETEEVKIYKKYIGGSELAGMPIAPYTFEFLAKVATASRMAPPSKCKMFQKGAIYDGADIREDMANAPTLVDLRKEAAKANEGMDGISTRSAFKVLERTANMGTELGIDPVYLIQNLSSMLPSMYGDKATGWKAYVDELAKGWLYKTLDTQIMETLHENSEQYLQNQWQRYVEMARVAINRDIGTYHDPETGQQIDKKAVNAELAKVEKDAGVSNPEQFRQDVVQWVLNKRVDKEDKKYMPHWEDYAPMRKVLEAHVRKVTQELLPLLTFGPQKNKEFDTKHASFVERMMQRGYTYDQVKRVMHWYNTIRTAT